MPAWCFLGALLASSACSLGGVDDLSGGAPSSGSGAAGTPATAGAAGRAGGSSGQGGAAPEGGRSGAAGSATAGRAGATGAQGGAAGAQAGAAGAMAQAGAAGAMAQAGAAGAGGVDVQGGSGGAPGGSAGTSGADGGMAGQSGASGSSAGATSGGASGSSGKGGTGGTGGAAGAIGGPGGTSGAAGKGGTSAGSGGSGGTSAGSGGSGGPSAVCGNGELEVGEECDGPLVAGGITCDSSTCRVNCSSSGGVRDDQTDKCVFRLKGKDEKYSWDAARAGCVAQGARLATFDDPQLRSRLASAFGGTGFGYWVGARQKPGYAGPGGEDEGWVWQTEKGDVALLNDTWRAGQPDDGQVGEDGWEDCGRASSTNNLKLEDTPCNEKNYALCVISPKN